MSTLLRSNTRDRSGSPKFGHMHHRKQCMELFIDRKELTDERNPDVCVMYTRRSRLFHYMLNVLQNVCILWHTIHLSLGRLRHFDALGKYSS